MSAPIAAGPGIARGLLGALRPALAPDANATTLAVARDVAQVMGLEGLDAVLAGLERLAGATRPPDITHVVARIVRLADEAEASNSGMPFVESDAELAALAGALAETEWGESGAGTVALYPVADLLADLPLEDNPEFTRARLAAPVAASLRAALEWIGADEALLVQGAVHDSALSLSCPVSHAGGVGPAGAVLAAVEGSLGPEDDGRWTMRVPVHADRPSFLLLRLGHVPVALPWHAVARMRMLPPAEWAAQPEGLLESTTPVPSGAEERPGALVALGLKRGWLIANRVVWRFAAVPEEVAERGPFGSSTRVVSVENGERYWVLEPAWLLRDVEPIPVPPPAPRPRPGAPEHAPEPATEAAPAAAEKARTAPQAPPAPEPAPPAAPAPPPAPPSSPLAEAVGRAIDALHPDPRVAPAPSAPSPPSRETPPPSPSRSMSRPPEPPSREVPRPPQGSGSPTRAMPRPAGIKPPSHGHLTVLRRADVVPLEPARPGAPPSPRELPGAAPQPSPEPGEPRPSGAQAYPARRALVADDSLVARIFLARLLERRGYVVELAGDGEGMWNALANGPWALVCADVTMPDSHGRPHLERLLDFRAACREPFRLVALTRDADEEREAADAGAMLHLRKPFDASSLDELLGR